MASWQEPSVSLSEMYKKFKKNLYIQTTHSANGLKLSQNVFARTVGQTTHVAHIRPKIPIEMKMENTNRISFMRPYVLSVCVCTCECLLASLCEFDVPNVICKTGIELPGHKYHAHGVSYTLLCSMCSLSLSVSLYMSVCPSTISFSLSFPAISFRF